MAIASPAFATPVGRAPAPTATFIEAALAYFRSPRMDDPNVRYALVREPTNPLAKPTAYETLRDLARAIQVDRGDAAIELEDRAPLNIRGLGEVLGVAVWLLGEDGARTRLIALEARHSVAPTIGRAA